MIINSTSDLRHTDHLPIRVGVRGAKGKGKKGKGKGPFSRKSDERNTLGDMIPTVKTGSGKKMELTTAAPDDVN